MLRSGDEALKEKRYEDAVEKFSAALEENNDNPLYLVKRAKAYIGLKEYTEALNDANRALSIDQRLADAILIKGIALFYVEEYESARSVFTDGIEMGSTENTITFKQWRRKCNAELDIEQQEEAGTTTEGIFIGIGADIPPEPAKPSRDEASQTSSESSASGSQAIGQASKMRYDWYQTDSHVIVTLMIKNVKKDDVSISFGERTLSASVKLPTGSEYSLELDLQHPINPQKSATKILTTKVELKMTKVGAIRWTALEGGVTAPAVKSVPQASSSSSTSYPTSSRSGATRDWDKLVADIKQEEKDEKLEGEAALNKFFREIYGNASDETKRAMNKSFVESGGTVLSTNWSEVGQGPVEMKPPDGMEFKKYEI
jgi:suppressor of G2 allele of SKP1